VALMGKWDEAKRKALGMNEPAEQPPSLFDEPISIPEHNARTSDPETSKRAARNVVPRASNQHGKLLYVYDAAYPAGLIDEEAGTRSGLSANRRCCYWKRCNELRTAGYIERTGGIRRGSADDQTVSRITEKGRDHARHMREL